MRKPALILGIILTLGLSNLVKVYAQDTLGGTVKYTEITKLDFSKRPPGRGPGPDDPRFKDFIASLPEESKIVKTLYFTSKESLYEEVASENEAVDPNVRRAAFFMNMGRKPRPRVERVYINLEKNKTIEQLNFMTRSFIVESENDNSGWKLTPNMNKILGYTCMTAEKIIEVDSLRKDTIVALFTPEIPLSIGPERYYGLPGLVLAVEKNSETIFLAASVDLGMPEEGLLVKPSEGKKVSKKELDMIIEEKVKEFEENWRHGGPGGGRHHH